MDALVIGYSGPGGHGRYCRTFTSAISSAGVRAELHSQQVMPRTAVTRLPGVRQVDRTVRTLANASASLRAIRATQADILHFQLITPAIDWMWIPRVVRERPAVLTLHNVEPHERSFASGRFFTSALLDGFDSIVVHTERNRLRLAERFPRCAGKAVVIPHGVWESEGAMDRREARQRLGIASDDRIVLFFGAIRRNKGLSLLLTAMACLKRQPGRVPRLLIAGDPGESGFKRYEQEVSNLGIEDLVDVRLGHVPESLVNAYYAAADVVALPYEETFQAQSGVLLDAYAYGVPVVVTDAGGIGETVGRDGTGIVAERDARSFAAAISALANDAEMRKRMAGQMQLAAVGDCSWTAVGQRTADLYRNILAVRASRRQSKRGANPGAL